jgi:hypothetical protein
MAGRDDEMPACEGFGMAAGADSAAAKLALFATTRSAGQPRGIGCAMLSWTRCALVLLLPAGCGFPPLPGIDRGNPPLPGIDGGDPPLPAIDGGSCVGHQCDDSMLTDPEGGQIILEYMYLDTELQAFFQLPPGVTTLNRVSAFFENQQTPDNNPFPMPDQCNNLAATRGWPEYIGSPHTDLDVGTVTLTGKNTAGADVTMPISKQPAGTDAFNRQHDIFYQATSPVADQTLKPDSSYAVKFGGSPTGAAVQVPATTLDNALFLSPTFQVNNPAHEDNGPLVAGTDYTVHWTPVTSANLPPGDEEQVITWLVGTNGAPTHVCPAKLADGQFTIPGQAITEYRAIQVAQALPPNKMILLRNGVVHQIRRLPNGSTTNRRRIDMLTMMSWAQLIDVQ